MLAIKRQSYVFTSPFKMSHVANHFVKNYNGRRIKIAMPYDVFAGLIQWLSRYGMGMTGVRRIFRTKETRVNVCKEMCQNKSVSLGCRGFNRHISLGCNFHRTTLTTKLVGFWGNSGWSFHIMACSFGELGYPGLLNGASLITYTYIKRGIYGRACVCVWVCITQSDHLSACVDGF